MLIWLVLCGSVERAITVSCVVNVYDCVCVESHLERHVWSDPHKFAECYNLYVLNFTFKLRTPKPVPTTVSKHACALQHTPRLSFN